MVTANVLRKNDQENNDILIGLNIVINLKRDPKYTYSEDLMMLRKIIEKEIGR